MKDGWGYLRGGSRPSPTRGKPMIPKASDIFDQAPQRYGRFDKYTRLGCAALALALRDAAIDCGNEQRSIGIVTSSKWETTKVDTEYYHGTLKEGGAFASPNLFSYTLPGVMLGECAVQFGVKGPTVCVGETEKWGECALATALRLLDSMTVSVMVAGWVDDPPGESADAAGAVAVVLERVPQTVPGPVKWIRRHEGRLYDENGREVVSLFDLFGL